MFKMLRQCLQATVLEDDKALIRTVRTFNAVSLTMLVTLGLGFFAAAFIVEQKAAVAAFTLAMVALVLVSQTLLRRGRIHLASTVLISGLWIGITSQVCLTGSLNTTISGGYIAHAVIAGMLLGPTAAVTFAVLSSLTGIGIVLLPVVGYTLPIYYPMPPRSAWFIQICWFTLAVPAIYITIHGLNEALGLARQEARERKEAEEALRSSEEKYRLLAENVSDVIWTSDLGLRMTYISPSVERLHGWTTDEWQSLGPSDYLPPASMERALKVLQDQLAIQEAEGADPNRVAIIELEQYRKNGSIFWTEVSARFLFDEGQSPVGIIGVTRDITERKRSEEQLKQEREFTDALFESVPGLLYLYDENSCLVRWNRQLEEVTGYSRNEMQGMHVLEWLGGREPSTTLIAQAVQKVMSVGRTEAEANLITRDAREIPYYFTGVRVNIGGKPYFTGIGIDITERKKTEETLWQYRRALDSSTDLVAGVDKDYRYLFANKAYLRHHRLDDEQIKGKYFGDVIGEEIFLHSLKPFMDRCLRGEEIHFETTYTYPESGLTYLDAWYYPLRDELGTILGVVGIARDVTERKRLEDQLRQAQKMEAIGTLAGGIAHDFNNLIHVIQGYAEIALLDLKKGQTGYSELHEVKTAAKGAAELTQGLLTFSRKVESKLRPVDLNYELEHILKMLERMIPKMIRIELNLEPNLHTVMADPAQLHQTVINLAVNARDAMAEGGTLVIETHNVVLDDKFCNTHLGTQPGDYVLLAISDTGSGMDKETLTKIFDPFFTTKELGKGTGLGLSIVYGIVKEHGGNIVCYSESGKGTTFKIYLPAIDRKHENGEVDESDRLIGGTETILLVDDEEPIRRLGENILTRYGYLVLIASDGREGLEVFLREKDRIDLVILDLIMPQMGGRECLIEILKIDPATKVLIASGYGSNGQIDMAMEEGARASIRKPYEAHQMLKVVRKLLDKA